MKRLRDPRLLMTLIISLTLLSAKFNYLFPITLQDRIEQGRLANILLIGIDARPGEVQTRGDTLILLSVNPIVQKVALVSIPRDTRIVFQGSNTKINMVNQLKGPQVLSREVGTLMGTQVDHYIVTNFSGFEDIIDILGGVYLDVDVRIQSYAAGVYLEKGYQRLNGKQALTYVRFRSNPDMDIGRVQRQQRLLVALGRQLMNKESFTALPRLIPKLRQSVVTNLSLKDMLCLGGVMLQVQEGDIISQTLPGYHYFAPYSGASYWEVDRQTARGLLEGLFAGETYDVRRPAPPWVNSG